MEKEPPKIYTVSQVNSLIRVILEENLPSRLAITGEITDWTISRSGHCYFKLKDENALLPCAMWASKFRRVKFSPENGLAVIASGHIDVYMTGGKYQFYVDSIQPAGVGALQLAFEQMVKKLQAEGIFDDRYKKPLPSFPGRIGILTSESGAAVHDIADSIHNRWPAVRLFLYPVPVQGDAAAEQIAAALRDVNARNEQLKLDVLIIGRGGGSLEDLWAFNQEVLARAIFDSKIPVISAVGHEIDTTIADLVADARASTPTKAGVIAVPDMQEVLSQLASMESRFFNSVRAKLKLAQQNLQTVLASVVFRDPLGPVLNAAQQLDETAIALQESAKEILTGLREKLRLFYEQIIKIEPSRLVAQKTVEFNNLANSLGAATESIINKLKLQLTAGENRLAGLNPKSVLSRGYTITTNKKTGNVLVDLTDVQLGDLLITELGGGNLIESQVKKKKIGTRQITNSKIPDTN